MKTTHKKHEIRFNADTEEWCCDALALSDKSLAKLKGMIDREGKKRRGVNIRALYLEHGYRQFGRYAYRLHEATIVLLREDDRKATIRIDGKRDKEQVELRDLFPVEQRKEIDAFIAASDAAEEAQEKLVAWTAEAVREFVARKAEDEAR